MRRESLLHFGEELRPNSSSLVFPINDDPVEIVRRFRPGRRTPARIPNQLIAVECADESVVVISRETRVEQLDRGCDLLLAKETGRPRQLLKSCAVRAFDGPQGR